MPGSNSHREFPHKPSTNLVAKALLLVAYFSLFSVQLCFRYTSDSFDLDAFRSSFVTAKAHQAVPVVIAAFRPTENAHHSILNKRYEPVNIIMDIPSGEFQVAPLYSIVPRSFYAKNETASTRDVVTAPSRGPPPVC